jgi:Protein of unknown function (DUF3761)
MRFAFFAAAVIGVLSTSVMLSSASADTMKNCAANWKAMSKADKAKTTYKEYSTSCMKGGVASATAPAAKPAAMAMPAAKPAMAMTAAKPVKAVAAMPVSTAGAPAGATGVCNDGTFTMSKTHSGACSHHKGVAKWL